MTMHADLGELAFLIGTWKGGGHGDYPTIDAFDYLEEISFTPLGPKPALVYTQKTRDAGGEYTGAEGAVQRTSDA